MYMSGGFYGMSARLLHTITGCRAAAAFRTGIAEDLQTGRMVKTCARQTVQLVNLPNGEAWCHSKDVTSAHVKAGVLIPNCSYLKQRHIAACLHDQNTVRCAAHYLFW